MENVKVTRRGMLLKILNRLKKEQQDIINEVISAEPPDHFVGLAKKSVEESKRRYIGDFPEIPAEIKKFQDTKHLHDEILKK